MTKRIYGHTESSKPIDDHLVEKLADEKERLARRAEDEGVPVSEVIRDALRHHLKAS